MKISFHGAARTVTGTKHIITLEDGTKILLDCGMFQGMGAQTHELNQDFGFDPASVSCLLLSHAHIDHTGLIPKLVKEGFQGKIYCTEATKELTEILLYDSAEIQTYEAEHINKRKNGNGHLYEPMYTVDDVKEALKLFETVEYDRPVRITKETEVLYTNTGHLVGSAAIHIAVKEKKGTTRISFSGDVGRYRSALLQPPAEFPQADYIILESTYGDKTHDLAFNTIDYLLKMIKTTCIDKKGKLIIPAFSVGRTQEILYALNQLELERRLPELLYFVDSPLSIKATTVIKHHMEHFNETLQNILRTDKDPFDFKGLKYTNSVEESKQLAEYNEPCVIISASGTADAGRVRHHIASCLQEGKNTILIVGYCQSQSLGGQLLQGAKTVEIFGDPCTVSAEIESMTSMSAHGDTDDLTRFLSCQDPEKIKGLFLVHGELSVQREFAAKLERKGFKNIQLPSLHEEYEL